MFKSKLLSKISLFPLLLFSLCYSEALLAREFEHNLEALHEAVLTFALPKENFRGYLLLNPVLTNDLKDLNPFVFRAGITYKFNPAWKFRVGYDNHLRKLEGRSLKSIENRAWQQLMYKKEFEKFTLKNRLMLEQRFVRDEDMSLRIRPRVETDIPITKDKKNYITLKAESFIYLDQNENRNRNDFSGQWFTIGLGRRINKKVTLEAGYRLRYLRVRTQEQDLVGHSLFTLLVISL